MKPTTRLLPLASAAVAAALLLPAAGPGLAAKDDRYQRIVVTSDLGGDANLSSSRSELNGNVVLTQGSLVLRAEKMDLRQSEDGYFQAYATGVAGKPVTFKQERDTPGEFIEGSAERLEYDTRADTVRFVGRATVRHLRGAQVAKEVTGAAIIFDKRTEVFALEGGATSPNPAGRTRLVIMPPPPPAAAASEPGSTALPLRPSTTLQEPPPPRKSPAP